MKTICTISVMILLNSISCFPQSIFSEQKIITNNAAGALRVFVSDIDGDGYLDILSASPKDHKIAWYKNIDGNGTFGTQKVISTKIDQGGSVYAVDLDNDNDIDILFASPFDKNIDSLKTLAWLENLDGRGSFGQEKIIFSSIDCHSNFIYTADLDKDGDMDILLAATGSISWFENIDGQGNFNSMNLIHDDLSDCTSIYAADLNGDGNLDVLSASFDKIVWYENTNGLGTFDDGRIITTSVNKGNSVYAADLDNDGDMDVLSASAGDNKIAWYKNINGEGTFGEQLIITTSANGASSVYAADLDNDSDLDILSASQYDNKVAWYKNLDGLGTFGPQKVITISAEGATSVYAADLDNDGDLDVLSASFDDNKIAWYENLTNPTSVPENQSKLPGTFQLYQNYPNPFNPSTTIRYCLPKAGQVSLEIYNLLGQKIETLVSEYQTAGDHQVKWSAEDLSSGIYIYRLQTGEFSETKKLILQK